MCIRDRYWAGNNSLSISELKFYYYDSLDDEIEALYDDSLHVTPVSYTHLDVYKRQGTGALTHSFTFSGNPLACAGAEAVLDYIMDHGLIEQSRKMGEIFLEKLQPLKKYPVVGDIRGIGLLLGVEFVKNSKTKEPLDFNFSAEISQYCFQHGIMITGGVTGSADGILGDALQIAPPFIISEEEINQVAAMLEQAIEETMRKHQL